MHVAFAWQLMTPTLGGTISSSFWSRYDATVQQALATGAYVILDLVRLKFKPSVFLILKMGYSTTMRDGTARSSTKEDPALINTPVSGHKLLPNMLITTKSSYVP
jgi:hypothetical protein